MTTYGIPYFDHGDQAPSLPYAGTSGWSGTEASRARAEDRDHSGKTAHKQTIIEDHITLQGERGVTIKELRETFPEEHHGTLSGILTTLHQDGRLARLSSQRNRCSIYVAPAYVMDRRTVDPKRRLRVKEVVLTDDMDAEFIGHLVIAALNEHDKITVRIK